MLPVCPAFIGVHGDYNIRPGATGDLTQRTLQPVHIPIADAVIPTVFVIDPRNSREEIHRRHTLSSHSRQKFPAPLAGQLAAGIDRTQTWPAEWLCQPNTGTRGLFDQNILIPGWIVVRLDALHHAATLAVGHQDHGNGPAALLEASKIEQGFIVRMRGNHQYPRDHCRTGELRRD